MDRETETGGKETDWTGKVEVEVEGDTSFLVLVFNRNAFAHGNGVAIFTVYRIMDQMSPTEMARQINLKISLNIQYRHRIEMST